MVAPLILALATIVGYRFPADSQTPYDVKVEFQGHMPLFGGKDADVSVNMKVLVRGLAADAEGNPQASSEIQELHVFLKAQEFPLDANSIQRYFPKTTISLSPQGKVLKTDAPNRRLPVRLPGLDAKRFPDITYLPLEFPSEGIELGKSFTFEKAFGDSNVSYTVTPTAISDASVDLQVKLHQAYTLFEDKFGNPTDEPNASVKVPTVVDGSGTAHFDRVRGLISELKVEADAIGSATDVASGKASERKLHTKLSVKAL